MSRASAAGLEPGTTPGQRMIARKRDERIYRASTPGLEVSVRPGASPSPLEPTQAISAQPFLPPPERRFGKIFWV
jgi:hypothetical protein